MQPLTLRLSPWIMSLLMLCGLPLFFGQAPVEAKSAITPQAVAKRLSGLLVYQLEGDRQIHMTTCFVTKGDSPKVESPAGLYLYQEQARDDKLDQPYRQRFLHLKAIAPNQVVSISYRPAHEAAWVGFCQKEEGDRFVQDIDLLPTHCTVTLQKKGRKFIGTTPEQGCASNYRGAAFVRNRVVLTRKGMKTYDQGFDANGNRVWGSDGSPYTFKKVSPE